ncbi:MAG TPA: long-chain fatty acid--CoA ligase [Sandaracinaceae bacterium]
MGTSGTLLGEIERWAKERPNEPALHDRRSNGVWEATTWAEYLRKVRAVGKGLLALGHEVQEPVAIVGNNRADWVICQHGINAVRGIPAPLYTTLLSEQMEFIVDNCQARIAICDEPEQLAKYLAIKRRGKTRLEHIITMDELGSDDPSVISLAELMKRGESVPDADLDARWSAIRDDDIALLIYTSGTTGEPKGAMYTHANIRATGEATREVYREVLEGEIRYISYLPLCHGAEQGVVNMVGLRVGAQIYFCPDIKQIRDYLVDVRPTVFFAVPRVWEKFETALRGRLAEATGFKAKLARWALDTELRSVQDEIAGKGKGGLRRALANRLVISKIKSALGLDRLRFAVCGAAPISRSTLEFFASIGIVIHEGFGMTETTAFATLSPYMRPKMGTIGKPMPGVEVKIAEDGEILLKGPNMVQGYYRMPDKSAELYSDGWMHTGDLGAIDEDGYLRITGRKKDLIITAGGKNVAPSELEGYMQAIPGVGQAVVVGDRQPYLAALIVLDPEALPALAAAAGIETPKDVASAARDPAVRAYLEKQIETRCNAKVARYQTIKKFEILSTTFSIEGGELTPTLKVKRNVVNEKYADVIARLYGTSELTASA